MHHECASEMVAQVSVVNCEATCFSFEKCIYTRQVIIVDFTFDDGSFFYVKRPVMSAIQALRSQGSLLSCGSSSSIAPILVLANPEGWVKDSLEMSQSLTLELCPDEPERRLK
jgi:hypothetical protein